MQGEFRLPEIVENYYDFCLWVIPKISKFQKDQRYILGTALENKAIQLLNKFIEAAKTTENIVKANLLKDANIILQQLRYHIRLAGDIKMLNKRSCIYAGELLTQVGNKTGLWYKSIKSNNNANSNQ